MIKSLEFTLSVSNCLSCHFCPQDKLAAAYPKGARRQMTLSDFIIILAALPKDIRVDFSGFSEPFLNPNASKMIASACKAGREVHLFTTLMGFTDGDVDQLRNLSISHIRLHVPDNRGLIIPHETWLKRFETFKKTETRPTAMAMGGVDPRIKQALREYGVEIERPDMLSRGGNIADLTKKHLAGNIRCAANRWHQNVVLPNGEVMACCMDYGGTMVLGNLLRQPYCEIESAANGYEANLNPPDQSICRSCEWSAPA